MDPGPFKKYCDPGCIKTGKHDTCHIRPTFYKTETYAVCSPDDLGALATLEAETRHFPSPGEVLKYEGTAKRFNEGKPQLSLIPKSAQESEAFVWMVGAKKYGAYNWQKGLSFLSVIDSLLRHATAYAEGETNDPESGKSHMAHIRCNAAMLIEYETTHPELDDRPKRKPA